MHDWTLLDIRVDWDAGTATLNLRGPDGLRALTATGATRLSMSRELSWGPSVSVNTCTGPTALGNGLSSVAIRMQSGDMIELTAKSFSMPTD